MTLKRPMLDHVAARAAHGLLAWSAGRVDPARRRWIDDLRRELDEIDGGWARLMWAMGGLRLVWTTSPDATSREEEGWPESWSMVVGALLLGALAMAAFTTNVPDLARTPAEMIFGFLVLYFYSVGFLSGRRTGRLMPGACAGAASGLTFGIVVCIEMYATAMNAGVREMVQGGSLDQVAIAVSGLVFFILIGAACGALGAHGAEQARRQGI